jgi:phosphoribosylformylglycinamidine synthase
MGDEAPDLDRPKLLKNLFRFLQKDRGTVLAYHDRSDGGLITTLLEMAFSARVGLQIVVPRDVNPANFLFNEELGVIIQVRSETLKQVIEDLAEVDLACLEIARVRQDQAVVVKQENQELVNSTRSELECQWAKTSYHIQCMRDNPKCAKEEFSSIVENSDPGLSAECNFDINHDVAAPLIARGVRPRIAILREQGVNSQVEMAAAFTRAGFVAIDVHMSEVMDGTISLSEFHGLAACGGFSYGDVLGAGEGWAKSILFHNQARDEFQSFFERSDTFTLGVCNGCQMLAALKDLIPGTDAWPKFVQNESEQFEARLSLVRVGKTRSIFLTDMEGSLLPVVVSHGEGRATMSPSSMKDLKNNQQIAMRFSDNFGNSTRVYPFNPNGSVGGLTGVTSEDGRVLAMMPHPERGFRSIQYSWRPDEWKEDGPWMRLFRNSRVWVD